MNKHRDRLEANPRLRMLFRTWDKLDANEREATIATASTFLERLRPADAAWNFDDDAC